MSQPIKRTTFLPLRVRLGFWSRMRVILGWRVYVAVEIGYRLYDPKAAGANAKVALVPPWKAELPTVATVRP